MSFLKGTATVSRSELLLTYIEGLEPYLNDPAVSEIMVVPEDSHRRRYLVFVEENGVIREATGDLQTEIRELHLFALARDIARNQLRREINEDDPALSATLENGSRIAVIIPPASDGVLVTIRNHREQVYTVEELIEKSVLPQKAACLAQSAVQQRKNILISGANGSGKTTMLNALASAYIPRERRVIVLEDTVREIKLPHHRNKGFLRAGVHGTMTRMLSEALRHKIVHVIVGEVIGAEGLDLLRALNTGHSGSFATIHADSATLALNRLTTCAIMAGSSLSYGAIRMMIGDSIHYVMQLEQRRDGTRRMAEFVRVDKYEPATDTFQVTRMD
jgi:pilus assembly protein CpaF